MNTFLITLLILFQIDLIFCESDSVFDRKLVKRNPIGKEILENFEEYFLGSNRTRNGVLGFMSEDENSYEKSVLFAKKFNYLSPPWFNIEKTGNDQYKITGVEKNDRKWFDKVVENNSQIRIVPRISFRNWKPLDMFLLSTSEFEWIKLSEELSNFCETQNIHGFVLDIFYDFYDKIPINLLTPIIQEISARLRFNYFSAFITIPTQRINLNQESFTNLAEYGSGVIFMASNEDFSVELIQNYIRDIAPEEILAKRIMFNVEFNGYGFDLNGIKRKINKNDYLQYLNEYQDPLEFDVEKSIGYFETKRFEIFYPTLYGLDQIIKMANSLETGVSISHLEDGLDYFYEVL